MVREKTEIIIDGVAYPVIKELEFNYVIPYGNDKRLFNKRKKRLVGSGYNDKKQKKNATVRTARGRNGTYDQAEHFKLIPRFNKIREKNDRYTLHELARNIGTSEMTLSNFKNGKRVNETTIKIIREWILENE
nr:MAG TPA: PURINE NUCLEOTIDE SYNTHESIS REPRESSOR/DNA Complex REGULATION, DNA-BINDING, REPRESSOR, PURINE [Caudoviricetes sp.]